MKIDKLATFGTLVIIVSLGLFANALVGQVASAGATRAVAAAVPAPIHFNTVIVPSSLKGAGSAKHDAFIPASWVVRAGQSVYITVYNTDNAPHSITAMGLGINFVAPAAPSDGAVSIHTFHFVAPQKVGVYTWRCMLPCDGGGVNAWAMLHSGYMAGTITVLDDSDI